MFPKISIVTPNYNKGEFLEYTIKSVLSQSYPNLEYIIIDGGSTDNSVEIIKKYQDHLSYWVSEPDSGMYDAIRKGFAHCTGDIMAWIGSDDMYHPNCFNIVAEIFKNSDVNWLVGATTHFDKAGRCVSVYPSRYFSRVDLLSGDYKWIQQESTFWRKSLYDKVGGLNATLRYAGDFDLWLRFSRFEKMYICPSLLGGFRLSTEGQLSLSIDKYEKEISDCIKLECTKDDAKALASDKKRKRIICFIERLKFVNVEYFRSCIFKEENRTADRQRFYFDRDTQGFRLPE